MTRAWRCASDIPTAGDQGQGRGRHGGEGQDKKRKKENKGKGPGTYSDADRECICEAVVGCSDERPGQDEEWRQARGWSRTCDDLCAADAQHGAAGSYLEGGAESEREGECRPSFSMSLDVTDISRLL